MEFKGNMAHLSLPEAWALGNVRGTVIHAEALPSMLLRRTDAADARLVDLRFRNQCSPRGAVFRQVPYMLAERRCEILERMVADVVGHAFELDGQNPRDAS